MLNLAKRALSLFESSEVHEKRALLNCLLQNSVVKGKKLEFTMRKPFDTLLSIANQPIGLRVVDDVRTYFINSNTYFYIPNFS